MNYAVEQRIRFIEESLAADGFVTRAAIVEKFRISKPQATSDLKTYLRLAPDNLSYDLSQRQYRKTKEFKPHFAA